MAYELGVAPAWLLCPAEDEALAVETSHRGHVNLTEELSAADPAMVGWDRTAAWIIGDAPNLLYAPLGIDGYFDFAPRYGMERRVQLDERLRDEGWFDVLYKARSVAASRSLDASSEAAQKVLDALDEAEGDEA